MEQHQFGLREWADLCERKDATIAALQARVKELEAIKIPDDAFTYCAYCGEKSPVDEHNEDLSAHIKVCPKHPIRDVEAQLTQRTAERDTARRRVDELEAREVDVVLLRDDLEKRTAELEAANKLLYKKNCELGRFETIISDLQAELERVRADNKALDKWRADVTVALQRPEGAFFVDVPQHIKDLVKERDELRTLIAALPKVEGEIVGDDKTGVIRAGCVPVVCTTPNNLASKVACILQHRQGMEE